MELIGQYSQRVDTTLLTGTTKSKQALRVLRTKHRLFPQRQNLLGLERRVLRRYCFGWDLGDRNVLALRRHSELDDQMNLVSYIAKLTRTSNS
jgi:hypothetical protein